ncbi:hypothetical protein HZS_232 [Henneguya salminicola]|nr:hypothetical protein HZS_232 [Henneguya salminicola]
MTKKLAFRILFPCSDKHETKFCNQHLLTISKKQDLSCRMMKMKKKPKKKKLQDAIYIPSNMTSEEFKSHTAVNNKFFTEEKISQTDIIENLTSQMFALVKAVILKMTILCQILSLLPLPSSLLELIRKLMQQNSRESYESFYKLDEIVHKFNLKNA